MRTAPQKPVKYNNIKNKMIYSIYNLLIYKCLSQPSEKGLGRFLFRQHAALTKRACSAVIRHIIWMLRSLPTICHGTRTSKQTTSGLNDRNITGYNTSMSRSYKGNQCEHCYDNKLFHFALSINFLIRALLESSFSFLARRSALAFWEGFTQDSIRTNFSAMYFLIINNLFQLYTPTPTPSSTYQHMLKYGLTTTSYAY